MDQNECYYNSLVGQWPNKEDCDKLHPNGCKDCRYYLPSTPAHDAKKQS